MDVFVSAPSRARGVLDGVRVSRCAAGRSHSVFVAAETGRCFVAGSLPSAEPSRREDENLVEVREISLEEGGKKGPQGKIITCAAGESQTFFLSSEGEVWAWLGEEAVRTSRAGLERPTARAVLGLPRVLEVVCGAHHALVLTEERHVFSFGAGCLGQLGLGACRRCPSPSKVGFPSLCDGSIMGLAAGFASSFAVTKQGWVYSWGCNEKCELGLGTSVRGTATPRPIDALSQARVVQVAAGYSHAACITDSGLLYLWGYGAYGQLGFGFDDLRSSVTLGHCSGATPLSTAGETSQQRGAGSSCTGHSRPWQQAWPRRCTRGPFASRRCTEVRCGAFHTLAHASSELLSSTALEQQDILSPLPLELSDMPSAANSADGVDRAADLVLPPGAGLVESPKPVLRHAGDKARNREIFCSIASIFWDTDPVQKQGDLKPKAKSSRSAQEGAWRRALLPPVRQKRFGWSSETVQHHPLQPRDRVSTDRTSQPLVPEQLPSAGGPCTWDEVDAAVHRAFCDASVLDRDQSLNLYELVENLPEIGRPEIPGEDSSGRGLPPSPCRGLARIECLMPRPFYLTSEKEVDDATIFVHGKPGSTAALFGELPPESADPEATEEQGDPQPEPNKQQEETEPPRIAHAEPKAGD
eukprot:TRINITY_DN58022_c0_g1_i1.p1 TRINITY_DN58022_c0_g1~~TRINITY_DN58022_c0_g1_i1.p1  ORF type:complete len:733 (-),score=121.86 TRINITY_DN58022_c0_g1_i1:25-1947(-)